MTNQPQPDDSDEENIHAATDRSKCYEMEKKYGWRLKRIQKTKDPTLEVDCVFYGKQTSFEDKRYE